MKGTFSSYGLVLVVLLYSVIESVINPFVIA